MARSTFRVDSNLAQLAALRAGFGIGAFQVQIARQNKDLVRVLESDFELALPVWIVMHEDLSSSPPCRAVFDALVDGMTAYIAA
ncbi:LysR substrate-binding domain-containing protein [Hartmannibacter diazotrophicus]|uniref:LysR substrate-binding domain-containing protein n=1 Tax=Hartmannibacter diazotrophicus TaxID=1482074 RepID=UPI000C147A74